MSPVTLQQVEAAVVRLGFKRAMFDNRSLLSMNLFVTAGELWRRGQVENEDTHVLRAVLDFIQETGTLPEGGPA